jgi:hypothetical protein
MSVERRADPLAGPRRGEDRLGHALVGVSARAVLAVAVAEGPGLRRERLDLVLGQQVGCEVEDAVGRSDRGPSFDCQLAGTDAGPDDDE